MTTPQSVAPPGDLSALFAPNSVAVVGASEHRDRLAGRPIRYLLDAGYSGSIFPINPKRETVQGVPAFSSIAALPHTPDVALIVVPASAAKREVELCAERGVRGVYLLAGGFAETGADGARIQHEIHGVARASGMRVLGPNCLGAFNAHRRFFGTFATSLERGLPAGGPVAIVSQSGAYGQHVAYLCARRGLGVGYLITTGNELDVELGECIEWLAHQVESRVILVYAECVRHGERFRRALDAARRADKAVVVLKVGSSESGARAAASHTAAMAGSDFVHSAVYRQHGAYRAASTEEQIDLAYALVRGRPTGRRIGIISLSGGFGVQAADIAEQTGLDVAPLPPPVARELATLLPLGGGTNPVDVTGQVVNDKELLTRAASLVAERGDYDALLVHLTTTPLAAALEAPIRDALADATADFRRTRPVYAVMVADDRTRDAYEAAGFLCFEDTVRAVRALGASTVFRRPVDATSGVDLAGISDTPPVGALLAGLAPVPNEPEAKAILRAAGLPVADEVLAKDAADAVAAARAIDGAVALKVVSRDIAHKTEIGGVLLDVRGDDAVRAGFDTLMTRARRAAPDAKIDGVLVSPMAPRGVETILGVARDPTFGPIVMFGLGGVFAESLRDVSFRAAPLDGDQARAMIGETRAAAILGGWRGAPAADVDALVDALVRLSRLAAAAADRIETIDVNPFLVLPRGQGARVLDAVIVCAHAGASGDAKGQR